MGGGPGTQVLADLKCPRDRLQDVRGVAGPHVFQVLLRVVLLMGL